jgi:hypothetical protein
MKNITTSVLGFEVPVSGVPENLEEAKTAAGGESNLLEGWLNYIRFHRTNTEARAEVADRIAALLGIERKTKQVAAPTAKDANNTREDWAESEADFVKRAIAESGRTLADIAPQIMSGDFEMDGKPAGPLSIEFAASGSGRGTGPGKVAQVYSKSAQQLIDKGPDVYNNAITLLQQANPGLNIVIGEDGKPDVVSLASALKSNRDRVEKEANAALGL